MRRTKLSLLTLLIFFTFFPSIAQDFEYEGIWYTVIDTEAKTCRTKNGYWDPDSEKNIPGNNCTGDVTIPSTVSDGTTDYTVTAIGSQAFYGCSELTSINLPDGVTSIEFSAFSGCSSLTSINIPDGLTSIGQSAFSGCSSLTSIDIPNSVTTIGSSAFASSSSLTSITIPDMVTSIDSYVFQGCSSLSSISIPASVTSIGNYAFQACSNLSSINIPDGVTSIGECAFSGCSNLTSIKIPSGMNSINVSTFEGCSSLSSISIPAGVTSIGDYAFAFCDSNADVTYLAGNPIAAPENTFDGLYSNATLNTPNATLTAVQATVPWNKFQHIAASDGSVAPALPAGEDFEYQGICYTVLDADAKTCETKHGDWNTDAQIPIPGNNCIGDVTIPSTVSDGTNNYTVIALGYGAFEGCSELTSIQLPESIISIGSCAFRFCSNLKSINIPDGVTSIEGGTFQDCYSLTSINIPEGVTFISDYSFRGCTNLTSINIPDGVTSIEGYTFLDCSSLSSITLPEGITSIGLASFWGCSSLTSINIPAGVTLIEEYAFLNCDKLEEVTYNASTLIEAPENLFGSYNGDIYGIATLNTPNATLAAVQATVPWNKFKNIVAKDGSLKPGLAAGTDFEYHGILYTVLDADAKTCETKYGDWDNDASMPIAGNNCVGDVTIPSIVSDGTTDYTVTALGGYAFSNCSDLTSIILPESITSISGYAFYGCSSLTSINIPNGVTSIDWGAFVGCSSLTSIKIPEVLTLIDGRAFESCSSLTSINIPAGVTTIGDMAFEGCSNLTSINIPDGVTSIGSSVFWGCSSLTSINIPDGLTSIGQSAFSGCSSLTSINIPDGVTSIREMAFEGCSNLTSINIPDGVTSIESGTFWGCSSLISIFIPEEVTSIGNYAFQACSSLSSINFPDGVTSIGEHTFSGCSSLTSINIPDGITSIGEYAFAYCYNAEEITYLAETPITAPENTFDDLYSTATLNTPNATLAAVKATVPWNKFTRIIASDGSIGINLALGDQFNMDGVLYTVIDEENNLVETATGSSIEEGAINFSGDLVISSPIVYNRISFTVKEIGDYSFAGSDHLTSVTIPASIVNIGENAFADCERLTSVIWQGDTRLQSGVVESIANPNLLVYVNSSSSAPEGLDHNIVVMNTADGIPSCESMILEKGHAFHPAIDFVSQDSRMTQDYTQSTIIGQSAGWETIVLPFDATSIYSEKQGELTPFAAVTNLEIQYPFWLYEADSQYEWKEATGIKAGVPYIISMPNNPDYIERFNIDGPVTFACSEPAMITGAVASPYAINWTSGQDFSSMWLPLDAEQAANALGLNVGIDNATDENGELLPPGSAFIQGVTPRPLDAFVTRTGAARIKKVVGDHSGVLALRGDNGFEIKSVDGEIILRSETDRKVDIFAIDGTHIRSIMLRAGVSETLRDITPGIYLIAGKKVIIR